MAIIFPKSITTPLQVTFSLHNEPNLQTPTMLGALQNIARHHNDNDVRDHILRVVEQAKAGEHTQPIPVIIQRFEYAICFKAGIMHIQTSLAHAEEDYASVNEHISMFVAHMRRMSTCF